MATDITDVTPLMKKYLGGGENLSNDEREILLFALYVESLQKDDGIVNKAIREIKAGLPVSIEKKRKIVDWNILGMDPDRY